MASSPSVRLFTALRSSAPSLPSQATRTFTSQSALPRWQTTCPTLRYCPQCQRPCYRTFTTSPRTRSSAKRQLMTESTSAYRPSSFESAQVVPPPARNRGVPETPMAGGLSGDLPLRDQQSSWPGVTPPAPVATHSSAAVPTASSRPEVSEGEAQRSASTLLPQTGTAEQPPTAKPARISRLRARKAAMTLTPSAVSHLRELLDQPEPKLIRVGVKNKGCSGSAYHLEYVDQPGTFDEQVVQDGVKVLIDNKALISIIGSEMDWVEDKLSARFTFRNPNITEQCGCGESFSTS